MGQEISKPLQGERLKNVMIKNDKGYWTQPFVDNLAEWSESVGPQIEKYPRFCSFKKNYMELMKSMVKGGWGDPQWDYKYMGESYEIWKTMKTIWNEGPKCVNKANKILTVKTPPPYDTAVITVQNNAKTSSTLYPSLLSFSSCAHPPPLPHLEMNKETVRLQSAAQPSMAWVQEGPRIILKPATMTDIDTICKTLPNVNNSNKFVDVLLSHTCSAQLSGSDYRSILLRVLVDDVTESSLIAEIPALNLDHDELYVNGIQRDPRTFWCTDPENITKFFKQVNHFLDARAHVCRDPTHATNTTQNKDQTTSAFVSRFKRVWEEDSHIPINGEMSSLFINKCLNNMNPYLARLVRVTTANLMQQTVEDFCKQIRELDASGGFTSFLFKPKQEVMFSAPQQRMTALSVCTKGTQRGGTQYISRLWEILKGPECVIIAEWQGTG